MPEYDFADAHCHLEKIQSPLSPAVLYITCGYSHQSNLANASIAEANRNVFLCAGIAPQEAMRHKDIKIRLAEWESEIQHLPKLVAIGEIGLDYHWAKTDEERFLQHECFISQLVLAEKLGLPAVIHSRKAEHEVIDILRNFNLKYMLHCFSGKSELADAACSSGRAFVSIPPMKSKERKKIIEKLPLDKLLAESDSPFIGKSPYHTLEAVKMVAQTKNKPEEDIKMQLLNNTITFFGLK